MNAKMKKKKKLVALDSPRYSSRRFRIERVKSCPLSQSRCFIVIDDALFDQLEECVSELHDEFIVFLAGERRDRVAIIRDAYVPSQLVSSASVEAEEKFDPVRFAAVAHSHHGLGAFHSLTDEEGVDNAPISIVMATRGWCAKFAHKLPCGRWGVSRNVMFLRASEFSEFSSENASASEVSECALGDCPERASGRETLSCGLRVRTNQLLREIKRKSKVVSIIEQIDLKDLRRLRWLKLGGEKEK